MGKYVVIEGVDTTGKSTQITLLRKHYKNAIFTKEPSGSAFGEIVRDLALHKNLDNLTQTLLFLADRADNTHKVIRPNNDKLIISDRSLISGIAYSQLDFTLAKEINLAVAKRPNLAIILETNEAILTSRLERKNSDDIESRGIKYLLEVQNKIIKTAEILNIKSIRIPCDKAINEISLDIIKAIDSI